MKRTAIVLILVFLAVPVFAGLKEKRAIKDFQTRIYPDLKKQIDAAAGMDVVMDVKWDSLAVNDFAHLYSEAFTKVYFVPLINAFKEICADDIGKAALKETLKKVVIQNLSDSISPGKFSFEDGVLVIDHLPATNIDDVQEKTDTIVSLLEDAL